MNPVFDAWQKKESAWKAYQESLMADTGKMSEQERFEHDERHIILAEEKASTSDEYHRISVAERKFHPQPTRGSAPQNPATLAAAGEVL